MSNTISEFIYGSAVDVDHGDEDAVKDMLDEAGVAYETPYDQNWDPMYIGERIESLGNGFGDVPTVPREIVYRVDAEYESLPDELKLIINKPSFIVLTRIN